MLLDPELQADVSDIIKMLGIVPPIKTTPVRYPVDPGTPGYPTTLLQSTGDGSGMPYIASPESQPPGTSEPVLHDFLIPKFVDAPMRQCSTLKNVLDQCSNGGTMKRNFVPYTDGLSQALANYKLVNNTALLSAGAPADEKTKLTENTVPTYERVPPMAANLKQTRAPTFKPIFAGQPTGFKLCRPPGSFLWPGAMNFTDPN